MKSTCRKRILFSFFSALIFLSPALSEAAEAAKAASVDASASFTDIEGNVYRTIIIGDQVWMASNFRSGKTAAGIVVPYGRQVRGGTSAPALYVSNQPGNPERENRPVFYNWPGALAVCPTGWHIPTEAEWERLISYLGAPGHGGEGTAAASKATGSGGSSGFDALFTGSWDAGRFFDGGEYAAFWSSTQYPADSRDMWQYKLDGKAWSRTALDKRSAFSLRLIKD